MADVLTGSVQNGVVVLDAIPGRPSLPDGTRVRVEVAPSLPGSSLEPDPLARTRAFLLAAARDAEAQAPPMPSDVAEGHDHYAHGKPRV